MIVLNSLDEIEKEFKAKPEVGLTLGNFDGVHIGHQELLKQIKLNCVSKNQKFVVVTFVPHPQKIIQPDKVRFLINSYQQRRVLLEKMGVDVLIEMKFTRDFSTLGPEAFLNKYLLTYSNLKTLYLGYDFAFGANKVGDHDIVKTICEPKGIEVEIQPKFQLGDRVVSSSLVREFLSQGRIKEVKDILKRPYHLEGVVVKGQGRGKRIGFPTANIQVGEDLIIPAKGVYITQTLYNGMNYQSITNIGNNPTFNDGNELHVETNLFDFDSDIYGEKLEIEFLYKIRDEQKFSTVNELIAQIKSDVDFAREYQAQK